MFGEELGVSGCNKLKEVSSRRPLEALTSFCVRWCNTLAIVLDLGMFPVVEGLFLNGCSNLKLLRSSVPLTTLNYFDVKECRSIRDVLVHTSYHYHSLALDILKRELAWIDDSNEWKEQLDTIDKDIFNQSNKRNHHPIFSILKTSFNKLDKKDQLLFMDIVLFLCHEFSNVSYSIEGS